MSYPWLFLHGINNTPAIWVPISAAISCATTTNAPFLPAVADTDAIAASLWQAQERVEPGNPMVIVGHSFGGYVALAMLEQHPECVGGIVLINSHTRQDSQAVRLVREQTATAAENGDYAALVDAVKERVYHASNVNDPKLNQQREQDAQTYGPLRFAAHQRACAKRPDRSRLLQEFTGHKLVLASEEDLVIATDHQQEMANNCGATFEVIAKAGHMLPAEQPARVADAINAWWQTSTKDSC
jgi:pimeloyl-ACP methyl ester carboxylesterase